MTGLRDFRIEVFFSKWEFKARYNLCASDIESMSIAELMDMAGDDDREAWSRLTLGYTDSWGGPALREAVAATYETMGSDNILCFAGAEEGIHCAMHALLGPDDHAVVITPNYQSSETIPEGLCAVTGVALDADDNWALDLDRLTAALRPNTRLISVNFPHNPTGKVIDVETWRGLIEIARGRGIYLFSDEVYRLLERDPGGRLEQAADVYERGLSLGVMSKAYGLAGLRVGWIACADQALLQRMERIKHYLSICNAGPSEFLATVALGAGDRIVARNRALLEDNLTRLDRFFADHAGLFDWRRPDGGSIGFPRYRGADGVEAFTEALVNETGVLLLPAGVFRSTLGPVPDDRFRISYGRRDMAAGLAALRDFLTDPAGPCSASTGRDPRHRRMTD